MMDISPTLKAAYLAAKSEMPRICETYGTTEYSLSSALLSYLPLLFTCAGVAIDYSVRSIKLYLEIVRLSPL